MADKKKLAATIAPIVNQAMTNIAQSITTAFAQQMQEFNNSLTDAEKKLVDSERALATAESENHKLGNRIIELQGNITAAKDNWRKTAEELNEVRNELADKDIAINALKSYGEDAKKRIEELESDKHNLETRIKAMEVGLPEVPFEPAEQPIPVATPIEAPKSDGKVRHAEMDDIIIALQRGRSALLCGPAGSGKSEIAKMIAEEMGLKFYLSSQVTQEYQVEGFIDAHGIYQSVPFFEAVTQGGVFVFEEMDASTPDVLVKINTALANGYATFPGKGLVNVHPDFHCIATGNTNGAGASDIYTARVQLDASTINRFVYFDIDYDERIEMLCARGDNELVRFVHDVRRAIEKCGASIPFVISYRNILDVKEFEDVWSLKSIMKRCVVKGLDRDNVAMIFNNLDNKRSRYAKALNVWGNYEEERAIA